jgi:zinc finger SWIM domain-containing protein 3
LSSDGLLSYTGGDAHVNDGSNFDESKLEMAQMWKYNPDSLIIIEYLLRDN